MNVVANLDEVDLTSQDNPPSIESTYGYRPYATPNNTGSAAYHPAALFLPVHHH
jgi:hypothetical protein